jgi:hypothetical protein
VIRIIRLAHGEAYHYYRNYPSYLESQRITFHSFKATTQLRVGWG